MALDVTIVVSTFGDPKWEALACRVALPSADTFGVPVVYNHGWTLHDARNIGLAQVETEWVSFLDADDQLEAGYFDEMDKVEADLRAPAVRYVGHSPRLPNVVGHNHLCTADCLEYGNWLVVGTVARTDLLRKVGGWRDYPVYEDFDLWQRCWVAGATVAAVPRAVYRANSNDLGRNKSLSNQENRFVQYRISKTNMPEKDWSWLRR